LALLAATVVGLVGAACGEEAGADDAPETSLGISVNLGHSGTVAFELECGPVGGSAPDPGAACAMLEAHPEMLAVPEMTGTCAGSEGISPEVTVAGESGGERVSLSVRECDEPEERASSACLWMQALDLPG
jgi:hypothetical protein